MKLSTKANVILKEDDMVEACNSTVSASCMKASGRRIACMALDGRSNLTAPTMSANGRITTDKAKAIRNLPTAPSTRDSGVITKFMEWAR